ncbi:MAG: hypothetical protein IT441_05705 [Phycisphaeraceae bacterium]|nr:hypothetical protein [Phycisphaeraceae bacterium]
MLTRKNALVLTVLVLLLTNIAMAANPGPSTRNKRRPPQGAATQAPATQPAAVPAPASTPTTPPAPVSVRKPDPAPTNASGDANEPDVAAFTEAYRQAGSPRVLVIAGIDNRMVESDQADTPGEVRDLYRDRGRVASGVGEEERYLGNRLAEFNVTGAAPMLTAEIDRYLLQAGAEIVSTDAVSEMDQRFIAMSTLSRDRGQLELLATKINADVVLTIRMIPGQAVEARGAKYRVIVETTQVASARQVGSFSFDWLEGDDVYAVKRYGQAISRRFMADFVDFSHRALAGAQRYSVRIYGIESAAQLGKVIEQLQLVQGVGEVNTRGLTQLRRQSAAELSLNYTGPGWQLAAELEVAVSRATDLSAKVTDSAPGSMTLTVDKSRGPSTRPTADEKRDRIEALADEDHPDHETALDQLSKAYEAAGKPRLAVLINRGLATSRDAAVLGPGSNPAINSGGGDQTIIFNRSTSFGTDDVLDQEVAAELAEARADRRVEADLRRALDLRRMEDLISEKLRDMGLTLVDADLARQAVAGGLSMSTTQPSSAVTERQVQESASKQNAFEVLVQGVGVVTSLSDSVRPVQPPRAGTTRSVAYSFRAVDLHDGRLLGSASGTGDLFRPQGQTPTHVTQDELANHLAAQIASGLIDSWGAGK